MKENKSYYLKFKIKSSVFTLKNKFKTLHKKRKSTGQPMKEKYNHIKNLNINNISTNIKKSLNINTI